MKTIIFVILYGKEIKDSSTLNSLISCESLSSSDELFIVNNGPSIIKDDIVLFKGYFNNVILENFALNTPLSKLYNDLIKNNAGFDRYVIFDDDTKIPSDFFSKLNLNYHDEVDIQLPKVISVDDDNIYYPVINGKVTHEDYVNFENNDIIYSIGSGLVIYKVCINKFKLYSYNLFDNSFALYGVDMSIFKRIEKLKKNHGEIFNIQQSSSINHSLSRVAISVDSFRFRERLIDSVLSSLIYPESFTKSLKVILKLILKTCVRLEFKNLILIFKLFLTRKHPRC